MAESSTAARSVGPMVKGEIQLCFLEKEPTTKKRTARGKRKKKMREEVKKIYPSSLGDTAGSERRPHKEKEKPGALFGKSPSPSLIFFFLISNDNFIKTRKGAQP